MLAYLLSGEYASAGELARAGSVTAATASGHLGKLQDGGLLVCEPRGRHRYYRLADAEVAHALSALALVAERGAHEQAWLQPQRQRLRQARCCYGHIGGRVGVALLGCLQQHGRLVDADGGWALTTAGADWLQGLAFKAAPAPGKQRFAYGCLDWSERRDHLAGSLANQLLNHFVDQGWLRRSSGGDRTLTPTPGGRQRLLPYLGLA